MDSLIPRSHHPDGWMSVYSTYDPPEAHIVAGRLKHEGLHAWVYQDALGSTIGLRVGPLGEVMVLVRPEDYAQAMAILAQTYDEDDEYWLEAGDEDVIDGQARPLKDE